MAHKKRSSLGENKIFHLFTVFLGGVVLVLIFWQGVSMIFAQVPPPASTICAISYALCPSGNQPPPPPPSPTYQIKKEILNPKSYYKPGDTVDFKITVNKSE